MSKASGLVLILGGLGVAGYVLSSTNDSGQATRPLQEDIARNTPPSVQTAVVLPEAGRSSVRASEVAKPAPAATPAPSAKPAAPAAPAVVAPAWTAPVVVTRAAEPATRTPLSPPPKAVAVPNDRASLARELQKELRRVGCYDGEINGAWTTSARRAMKSFTDRVNATLPIDEPDYILLSLVQSHPDKACGMPCPAGQAISEEGRCMPAAIMAHAARKAAQPVAKAAPAEKATPAISGWSTTATAAAPSLPTPPGEGRMALAGPKAEQKPIPADDRARLAAIAPAVPEVTPPPTVRDEPRGARHYGPVPPSGMYDRRPRYAPSYRPSRASRQNSFARSVFRRMEANNF